MDVCMYAFDAMNNATNAEIIFFMCDSNFNQILYGKILNLFLKLRVHLRKFHFRNQHHKANINIQYISNLCLDSVQHDSTIVTLSGVEGLKLKPQTSN